MRAAMFWLTVLAAVSLVVAVLSGLVQQNGFAVITDDLWFAPAVVGVLGVLPVGVAGVPWFLDRRDRNRVADWAAVPAGIALTGYGFLTALGGGGLFLLPGILLALTRLLPDE